MARPRIPIDDRDARFRYTAAQAFSEGSNQRQTVARLREVYPQLTAGEALRYAREGRNANTLAEAYLSGDDAAVISASANQPDGAEGRRVLSVNARIQDNNLLDEEGNPTITYRTIRVNIAPGETAEEVLARLEMLSNDLESRYQRTFLGWEALSALDL